MNIRKTLEKIANGEAVTQAEKDLLMENKEVLSEEQVDAVEKTEVSEEETEEEEEDGDKKDEGSVDEEALKDIVSKSVAERMEKLTDELADKFLTGVASQRKKAIDTGKKQGDKTKDEKTKDFMKALFKRDYEALKDISGSDDDTGGYLIPTELRSEVLRVAETQYGLARRAMRYLPFTGPGNERKIPALDSSVSVSWTDEAAAKDATAPTFDVVTQTLRKLAAIVPMTEEIIEDSSINLTQLVAELFAEAVAKEEDEQFFAGTGSPWTGILNNGEVNTVRLSTTDPADVTADDLLNMVDETPSGALDGAGFIMNRSMFSAVRKLKDDNGQYIVQMPTDASPATMWGWPVETSDAFPRVTDTGEDKGVALFGNLSRTAIFGDKQQLRVKLLDEATVASTDGGTINLAQQDMVAVRVVERVGYVLALPKGITVLKTTETS